MQFAPLEARETERLQKRALLTHNLLRHELADTEHLVAVIGIGDHIDILAEHIEHREIVRREAAEAARFFFVFVERDLAFEALLAMRQHRAPCVNEVVADDEIGRVRTVRIDRDAVGILVHLVRRRTALDAAEIEVELLKRQNKELQEKIDRLNREIGRLEVRRDSE